MTLKEIIMWILIILSMIMVFWYLLGNSPTFEQTLLGILLTLSVTILIKLSVLETKFRFLARDFRIHINKK